MVDGILRRMAMNQNLRTANSINALIEMIKRDPLPSEGKLGYSAGCYGIELTNARKVDQLSAASAEMWFTITGMAMGTHGEKSTSKEGLEITTESGKGYHMFFEQVHLNLGSTWSARTSTTWAAGCAPPFENCWKDPSGIRVWFVLPQQLMSAKSKGEDAARETADEVASGAEWYMRDYIQRMRGVADPGKKIAVQTVLTRTGDYEHLCKTVREIKKRTHETVPSQHVGKDGTDAH